MAVIFGTLGDDLLKGTLQTDTIAGDAGQDTIFGSGGDDYLYGGAGNDDLYGETGNDHLYGGAGNDHLEGGEGNDFLSGGVGDDNIEGSSGNDLMSGGTGRDRLSGGVGIDHLNGGDGNDTLAGEQGADWLDGGAGNDLAFFMESNEAVQINLMAGTSHGGTAEGDHLSSIEGLWGTGYADLLIGAATATYFEGLSGGDTMIGQGGADYFDAQEYDNGATLITGGGGADHIDGGDSYPEYHVNDTAAYLASPGGVSVDLVTGFGFGGDAEGDRVYNIESLVGSAFADTFKGTDVDNKLEGGGGNDEFWGRDGQDRLIGGAGDDRLVGNDGQDFLFGNGGADSFVYRTIGESSTYTFASDVIADFSHADGDKIDLSWLDAKASTLGDQAFAFVGKAGFSAEGQVGYQQILGNTYVQVNQTGTHASDMTIKISGLHDLLASDFIG